MASSVFWAASALVTGRALAAEMADTGADGRAGVLGSLQAAFDMPLTWLIVALLLVALVVAALAWGRGWRESKRLRSIVEFLVRLTEERGENGVVEDIDQHLVGDDYLARQWRRFRAVLVDSDGLLLNPQPAASFFRDEDYLSSVTARALRINWPFRDLRVLPGVMTGLGMLGTFVGIAFGLGNVQGLESVEPGELFHQVGEVVVGLSSAFWTSIFGLLLALLTTVLAGRVEEGLVSGLASLRQALDSLFRPTTSEDLLSRQGESLRRMTESSEGTYHALQTLADDVACKISDTLHSTLDPALQEIVSRVNLQMEQATAVTSSQAEAFTAAMVDKLVGALEGSAEKVNDSLLRFAASFDRMTENTQLVGQLYDSMAVSLDQFTNRLEARHAIEEELLGGYRQLVKEQGEVVGQNLDALATQRELTDTLGNQHASMAAAFEHLHTKMAAGLEAQHEKMAAALGSQHEQIAVTFRTQHERIAAAFEGQQEKMAATTGEMSSLGERIEASTQAIARQAERGTEALQFVTNNLVDVTKSVEGWREQTTEAVNSFGHGLSDALRRTLEQYDKHLEGAVRSLGSALSDLEEVVEKMARIGAPPPRPSVAPPALPTRSEG